MHCQFFKGLNPHSKYSIFDIDYTDLMVCESIDEHLRVNHGFWGGVYAIFDVLYGNHYLVDYNDSGRKGALDYVFAIPLLSRCVAFYAMDDVFTVFDDDISKRKSNCEDFSLLRKAASVLMAVFALAVVIQIEVARLGLAVALTAVAFIPYTAYYFGKDCIPEYGNRDQDSGPLLPANF